MPAKRTVHPAKVPAASLIVPNPARDAKKESKGLEVLASLQAEYTPAILQIASPEGYESADAMLGRIQKARKQWNIEWYGEDGKSGPIPKSREVLEQLYAIIRRVDKPLESMETAIKKAMKDFKLEELRLRQEIERSQADLQKRLEQAQTRVEHAPTPQAAGLAQKAVNTVLDHINELEDEKPTPAFGFSSSVRAKKVWKIGDMDAFIAACQDGTYDLSWLTFSPKAKELLDRQLKDDPAGLAAWPGIVVEDDINIVGR